MKRFLLFFLLPLSSWAVTRNVTISAPASVTAGQAFLVPTSASTDAGSGEQIGFYHAEYSTDGGASWTGFCYDVNVGSSASRNAYITAGGAGSTVAVRLRIAFRGGPAGDVDYNGGALDWGGTWNNWQTPPTQYAYISVVSPPNQPPIINWIQNPANVYANQNFAIQSRGNDPDGNLSNVSVWKEWVPFAFNGGGNGYENYSDPNVTNSSVPGATINFQTQAQDSAGATSAVIFHMVTVLDRPPTVQTSASPTTIDFGQTTTITSVATDLDGNLAFHGILVLNRAGNDWNRGVMCDHSTGWGNHPVTPDILSANYTSGVASGSTSTRSIVHRPSWVGTQAYHSNAHDGIVWADSDPANWALCVGYASVVVNKATPTGTFSPRSFSTTHTLTAGDLNAVFTNPYSSGVAQPTGTVTYNYSMGAVLYPGSYTLTATYSGDSNYNGASISATWTVGNTPPALSITATPRTINFGQTTTVVATGSDVDGNLFYLDMMESSDAGSTYTRPHADYARIGWNSYPIGSGWSGETFANDQIALPNYGPVSIQATFQPPSAVNRDILGYAGDPMGNTGAWMSSNGGPLVVNKATPTGTFSGMTKTPQSGATYTVTAGDLNATFVNPYSGSVTAPTGAVTYSIAPGSANGAVGAAVAVGTTLTGGLIYTIRASYPGDGNYGGRAVDAIWTINKGIQAAVTINSSSIAIYGTPYQATAINGSGSGAIVWSLGAAGTASGAVIDPVSGGVTTTSVGTVNIKAYRAADANYAQSAATADFPITFGPRSITVTLAGSKTFDGTTTPTGATASITSGSLAGADTVGYVFNNTSSASAGNYTGLTTATASNTTAPATRTGSYAITYAGSYAITSLTAQGAVSITSSATAIYGSPYTATATGGDGTGAIVWSLGTGSTASNAAINSSTGAITANSTGKVIIKAYRAADATYAQSATTANFTVTFDPCPITVTLAGSKTYDGTTTLTGASASITSGSLAGSDTVSYAFSNTPSGNVGIYPALSGGIAFRSSSHAGSSSGSLLLSKPAGTSTNDVLLVLVSADLSPPGNFTAPSGWTSLGNVGNGYDGQISECFGHLVDGSEGATFSFGYGSDDAVGIILCYSGVNTVVGINVPPTYSASDTAIGSGGLVSAPSIIPISNGSMLVWLAGLDSSGAASAAIFTPPSGYTLRDTSDFGWSNEAAADQLQSTVIATGVVSGSVAFPDTAGTFGFMIALAPAASQNLVTATVSNPANYTITYAGSYTIASASPSPVITSATTASGQAGVPFSYQITASNSPTSFSATGLPAGLTLNASTGLISGTPTAAGTSSVTIGATNAGGTGTATLTLIINAAANTAPTITSIANQTSVTGVAVGPLSFTIGDAETSTGSLTVTKASSNTTLMPTANIALSGSGASRTVTVTPAASHTGTATITLTVSDGSLTTNTAFSLTVSTNTAPTITSVANQTTSTGVAVGPLAFTVGDAQTAAGSLTVTRTSSNTTLVPTANIVLGGSGANRTVTVTPAAGHTGTATITLKVSDGSLNTSTTFTLTVSTNTAPTITSVTNQTTTTGAAVGPLAFTVGDAQTVAESLTVTRTSSNTALVPTANIVLDGSGAGRTVTVTPAAGQTGTATITLTVSDGSLMASTTFTLTVTAVSLPVTIWSASTIPGTLDGGPDSAVELGVKFRSDVVGTISGIRFYKSTPNTGTHVGHLWTSTGTLLASATFNGETASGWQQVSFSTPVTITPNIVYVASYYCPAGHYSDTLNYFTSSGTDNAPLHALSTTEAGGNGLFAYGASGTFPSQTWNASNYWVDVVFQASGPAPVNIALTLGGSKTYDGTTVATGAVAPITTGALRSGDTISCAFGGTSSANVGTYYLTITPTIKDSANNNVTSSYVITYASGSYTINPPVPVIGSNLTATGQTGVQFSYQITASNTPTSFSAAGVPAGLSVNTSTGLISGTPTTAATSSVTIGATNAGGTGTATLTLTVNAGNTAPTITSITNQSTTTSVAVGPLSFTVGDAETAAGSLTVTKASSNTTLLPTANIVLGGSGATRTVTVTPAASQTGTATITLTVSDGSLTTNTAFTLTVNGATPVIGSLTTAGGQTGAAFSYQITATNSPTSFNATGLPPGLTVNTSTGLISGTPTKPGAYTVTISATNAGGTASTSLTITILASLPYTADFETAEGYTAGTLQGQMGWTVNPGTASLTTSDLSHGAQSVLLAASTPAAVVTQNFASTPTNSIEYFDFFAKPVAQSTLDSAGTFTVEGAKFALQLNGGQGLLRVFAGNGSGVGAWTSTAYSVSLGASNQSLTWVRFTVRLDFTNKTWDMYANGAMVAADIPFISNSSTALSIFQMQGDVTTASGLDYIYAGPTNPVFGDTNNNGIDDSWETAHSLSLSSNNRNTSPTGNGITVIQAYVAGTNPTDFFNSAVPTLVMLGGDNQVGLPGQFNELPFDMGVWNAAGTAPLVNAPVTFTVQTGGGGLSLTNTGAASGTVGLTTDGNGTATVYFQQPATPGVQSTVLFTAGTAQAFFFTTAFVELNAGNLTDLTDSDHDGLPDAWEMLYFHNLTSETGAMDFDGDGISNAAEYRAGTNPIVNEKTAGKPDDVLVVLRTPKGEYNGVKTNWSIIQMSP